MMAAPAARKVLLIDDDDDARELLSMALELRGHSVATAGSGPDGLACAVLFSPDIVFLDLGMPDVDGYDTALALRRLPGLALVWIVALSGWNDKQTIARTASAGFDHHLTKPADFALIDSVLSADLARTGRAPLRELASQL